MPAATSTTIPITPIPIPASEIPRVHSVLLFGGTFDPPHLGHTRVPGALRAAAFPGGPCAGAVWFVYIPAARSPLKSDGPVASDADRAAMLRLATIDLPHACVWTDELDRAASSAGPSFTIDTVRRARDWLDANDGGKVSLRLVIGADQAAKFHTWRDPRDVINLAEPLVMGRRGVGGTQFILQSLFDSGFWTPEEMAAWRSRIHELRDAGIQISATQLREQLSTRLHAHEDDHAPRPIDPRVAGYILAHNLYA